MGTDERTPREATIETGDWWGRELRQAVKGLARHCGTDADRPARQYACRHQYDGRSWLVATDGYRALFIADRLDISALSDAGIDGIHRSDLHAAAKRKLYDGPVTMPVQDIPHGGAPNVVGCIPAPTGTVTIERNGNGGNLLVLAEHDAAGFERGHWQVRSVEGKLSFPLACRRDYLDDVADALNTNRLTLGFRDKIGPPLLVRDAEPPSRVNRIDGFALVMPVRMA